MTELIEALAAALERPRELSVQVISHITGTYSIDRETVGAFLVQELPRLEVDEIDLILSPVFTPKLADQAVFAALLGRESIPRPQWPNLIAALLARPVRAQLVTPDRQVHPVPLRDVTLERYVHRLRLDGTTTEAVFQTISAAPPGDRPVLLAIVRRAAWDNDARRAILGSYLDKAVKTGLYGLQDAIGLLRLMEDYRPKDVSDLLARIPPWLEGLRHEIDTAAAPKPFFSSRVQMEHGGENDQRHEDSRRVSAKKEEFALLSRLQQIL